MYIQLEDLALHEHVYVYEQSATDSIHSAGVVDALLMTLRTRNTDLKTCSCTRAVFSPNIKCINPDSYTLWRPLEQ